MLRPRTRIGSRDLEGQEEELHPWASQSPRALELGWQEQEVFPESHSDGKGRTAWGQSGGASLTSSKKESPQGSPGPVPPSGTGRWQVELGPSPRRYQGVSPARMAALGHRQGWESLRGRALWGILRSQSFERGVFRGELTEGWVFEAQNTKGWGFVSTVLRVGGA